MDENDSNSTYKTTNSDLTFPNSMLVNGIAVAVVDALSCKRDELGKVNLLAHSCLLANEIGNLYIHVSKDLNMLCSDEKNQCESKNDPSKYNLSEDFIYLENQWGTLFFKHIGKMERAKAKEMCSSEGTSVHLPIPRFPEENEFYRIYFGHDKLWLGVSNSDDTASRIFKTDEGQILFGIFTQSHAEVEINQYSWINGTQSILNSNFNDVSMSNSGQWQGSNETELLDSVCIFNILPDECSKCLNQDYCRYKDENREEVECICPNSTQGDHCEINRCSKCLNGGQCYINAETSETECACIHPFHGKHCESR